MRRSVLAGTVLVALVLGLPVEGVAVWVPSGSDTRLPGAYKVQARVDEPDVVLGEDTVRFTGQVRPYAPRQRVVLQHRTSGTLRWKTSGQARIKQSGRFVLKDRPATSGVRSYRVVKPASAGTRWGRSRTMDVAVREWENLVDQPVRSTCGIQQDVDVRLGGETYTRSLLTLPTDFSCIAHVNYDLGGRCVVLRGAYGMTDNSTSGSVASISIRDLSDSDPSTGYRFSGDPIVFRGQVLDVSEVQQLTIGMGVSYPPGIPGFPAVGHPEVLCLP